MISVVNRLIDEIGINIRENVIFLNVESMHDISIYRVI